MTDQRTWGVVRWIYLGAGAVAAVAATLAFVTPDGLSISPWLIAAITALILGVALFASNASLERIHRIFWHRQWPK
jgi:peptidoglycan/LPS O-acetylase OafA/YrhL